MTCNVWRVSDFKQRAMMIHPSISLSFTTPPPRTQLSPQVRDLLKKMTHPGRQTLLFSATMPTAVAEFARAGLKDPEIIRLDAENKISDKLEMAFIRCRDDEKDAALLFLLKSHIPPTSRSIIFAPTKHHVEYVHMQTNNQPKTQKQTPLNSVQSSA